MSGQRKSSSSNNSNSQSSPQKKSKISFRDFVRKIMNPRTRTLIKVSIDDISDADNRITTLMGDQVEPRRQWIEQNVSFDNEDNFDLNIDTDGDLDE